MFVTVIEEICGSGPAGSVSGLVDGQAACRNGGRCIPNANSNIYYSCDCSQTQYTGPLCETPGKSSVSRFGISAQIYFNYVNLTIR